MRRIDRTLRRLANQDTARSNAAEASATLRRRRHEQDEVDAYLEALNRTGPMEGHSPRRIGGRL